MAKWEQVSIRHQNLVKKAFVFDFSLIMDGLIQRLLKNTPYSGAFQAFAVCAVDHMIARLIVPNTIEFPMSAKLARR